VPVTAGLPLGAAHTNADAQANAKAVHRKLSLIRFPRGKLKQDGAAGHTMRNVAVIQFAAF